MKKIGELTTHGFKWVIMYKEGPNPYRLYRKHYHNGWHQVLIAKYTDVQSCLAHIMDALNNLWYTEGRR